MTDLMLACDMIVGSGRDVVKTLRPGDSKALVNADVTPTGEFQTNRDIELDGAQLEKAIRDGLDGGEMFRFNATRLATDLVGDSIATNVLMVGYAAQKGLLPVSTSSLEEAIRLNGTFVEGNLRTFALGRLAAHAPEAFVDLASEHTNVPRLETTEAVIASRKRLLTDYQNAAYAQRYEDFVRDVERRVSDRKVAGSAAFVREVALTLARLMAYKDEYEVARLHSDPKFLERLNAQFAGDFKLTFHLAPPMLPGRDPATGLPRKREFGAWMLPVFRVLKSFKALRGTPFDVFGHTQERRMERRLIEEYRATIDALVPRLTEHNLAAATELARAAADVRGYGHVKHESVEAFHARKDKLLSAFDAPRAGQPRKTIHLVSEKS